MGIAQALQGRLRYTILSALAAVIVASLPLHAAASDQSALIPIASLGPIQAIGIAGASPLAYIATSSGLYRSASLDGALWTKQDNLPDIRALSPNPEDASDLLYTRDPDASTGGTYRSTDQGRTSELVSRCGYIAFGRSTREPQMIYVGSGFSANCSVPSNPPIYAPTDRLARSTDGGFTWTTVYTDANGYDGNGGFEAIAVSPNDPLRVFAADDNQRGYGDLIQSVNGGRSWHAEVSPRAQADPYSQYAGPSAITIDPTRPSHLWVIWSGISPSEIYRSPDNGRTWRKVMTVSGTATDLQVDPVTGRVYVATRWDHPAAGTDENKPWQGRIYAFDADGRADRFVPAAANADGPIGVLNSGYLLIAKYSQHDLGAGSTQAVTQPLIGAGQWGLSSIFQPSSKPVLSTLGQPISPTDRCNGAPCQYFVKGALAVGPNGVQPVALVPRLLSALVRLPVGGSTSTLTYATLMGLHSQRVPLPAGFHGGTIPLRGGVFVPYSATLRPASGYVVPPYFWRYLNDRHAAPDGWLRDFGLPLTPAASARVDKGRLGVRRIVVQAFQNAVLTYDPRNATPFRVERANVGTDYAAAFPQAVR